MKKLLAILMSAAIALSIAACGAGKPTGGNPANKSNVEIPNPFVDCETMEEAQEKAGFDMALPDTIDGYDSRKISVIEKELISVIFVNDKDGQICFRKGVGEKDVSGDFNQYAETEQIDMGGTTITLKGSDGKVNLAVWTKDGYAFSISSTDGLSKVTMTDLVTALKDDVVIIGGDPATWGPGSQPDVEIPNPYTDCDTLADAARKAGFDLTVPNAVNGATDQLYRVMTLDGKMLEVIYQSGEDETARIRKAPGTEDISGDFNEYAQTDKVVIGGAEVTMRGSNDMVCLATWTVDGYTYAVSVANGVSSDGMAALISEIH